MGATSDEYGLRYPFAVWPWAQEALGDAQPDVLPLLETNLEAIARPDLVLGLYAGLSEDDYRKLSQIAPTVAQSGDDADYGPHGRS